jgi:aromatic-L-amino-acid/L-tryptophan decarboxylase
LTDLVDLVTANDAVPSREADIEAFRQEAHRVVDWAASYLGRSEQYPVLSQVSPGDITALLPVAPPLDGLGVAGTIGEVERVVVPGLTHWNSPEFMAYFATTSPPPGIIGELYTAALNQNALVWQSSPAIHEVEGVVLDWLRQMIGLPEGFFGIIYDTASISTLCAVAAARARAVPDVGNTGMVDGPRLRMYASQEAHSVVDKAATILGIGRENLRKIAIDEDFRMKPEALNVAIEDDLAAGFHPFCVVATVGTTSTTSVDPVSDIADIAERHGLWLHVDAAYGGAAAILPEMRWILGGAGRADSLCLNPHKWLFVPVDLSAFYTRHPNDLRRAFAYVRPYLETDHDEEVANLSDFGPQLGRRFRGLKLWLVIRAYGVKGLQEIIRGHIELAKDFEAWIRDHRDFELLAPRPFSTVCFRAHPPDVREEDLAAVNADLLRRVNATGDVFISHTTAGGRYMLRVAIGNMWTKQQHMDRLKEILATCLAEV